VVVILNGDGEHAARRIHCGLKQRRVEGQDLRAVAGRSLGKDRDRFPPGQACGDVPVERMRGAGTIAPEKQRFVVRGQPSEDRPRARLVLGDEGARQGGPDREDVEPGDVVGGNEHRVRGRRSRDLQPHAERREQLPAPSRANRGTLPGTE